MRLSISALPLISAALLLGACGSGEADSPATSAEIKAEMAKAVKPRPGMYRTAMKVTKFEIPGMPADQAAKMQGMFASAGQNVERCMTQAEADKGFEDFTKKLAQGDCTAEHFAVAGGDIDARFACRIAQGATANVAIRGKATAESSNLTMNMEAQAPPGATAGPSAVRMEMEVNSTRIGDCPG